MLKEGYLTTNFSVTKAFRKQSTKQEKSKVFIIEYLDICEGLIS
jgi:hypothetical protein